MGVYIPNMEKPKECGDCNFVQAFYDDKRWLFRCLVTDKIAEDCPLIEIDENDPMLLEFLNEFTNMRQPINGFCNWGERK